MKNDICGTYWLCRSYGSLWLTQGNRPTKVGDGCFKYNHTKDTELRWLELYDKDGNRLKDYSEKDGKQVTSADYHHLKFPEVSEGECIEIEIGKTGRVYTYE